LKYLLFIIAGPNGAGKSTFHASSDLSYLPFVNADNLAKARFKEIGAKETKAAQEEAQAKISELLATGVSFCFETVFSHPSKIDLIHKAHAFGYKVELCIVSNDDPKTNILRVKRRAAAGGHDVPEEKITSRRPRTLANLRVAIALVDGFRIIDTSGGEMKEVATKARNTDSFLSFGEVPAWAREMLDGLTTMTTVRRQESGTTAAIHEQDVRVEQTSSAKIKIVKKICGKQTKTGGHCQRVGICHYHK
jgi:predicted ABC-type ATPase